MPTTRLAGADEGVRRALAELETLARKSLSGSFPHLPVHFDLAELRGYHYHRGVVFAALLEGYGRELARGGRYDGIGKSFGRAQSRHRFQRRFESPGEACREKDDCIPQRTVFAPVGTMRRLVREVASMRAEGWCVIRRTCRADRRCCRHGLPV